MNPNPNQNPNPSFILYNAEDSTLDLKNKSPTTRLIAFKKKKNFFSKIRVF